jgi:hypothetical protein
VEADDSSNTAIAHLYRRMNNQLHYMDSREFWKYGYYWFTEKLEGEYLIRVDLLPGSVDYGFFAPSYFGNSIIWSEAQVFSLESGEQFDVNIQLVPLNTKSGGVGSIEGFLLEGQHCAGEELNEEAIIYLFDGAAKLINYTYATPAGAFRFDGLAMGNYQLKVELAGKIGEQEVVSLSAAKPAVDDVTLQFDCNAYLGIMEVSHSQEMSVRKIYPQPASDYLMVEVEMRHPSNVVFELHNINGIIAYQSRFWLAEGIHKIPLDQLNLSSGMYILKLSADGLGSMIHEKVIVYR